MTRVPAISRTPRPLPCSFPRFSQPGSWDNTAKVWDAETGKELLTVGGHSRSVQSVAWGPDGKRLASASLDAAVQVYAMDVRDLMALARQRVTAHPSEERCKNYLNADKCPPFPELSWS
ncbi:MAG: hypothetical protein ABSF71_37825 [Terriglobia bacterium]